MQRAATMAVIALAVAPLAASAAEIALSFGDAPAGTSGGFRIERREADDKRFHALALVGPGVPDFVDRGLPAGVTYCYRVRSLAAEGESAWSPEVCTVAEDEPALAEGTAPAAGEEPAVAKGAAPAAEGAPAVAGGAAAGAEEAPAVAEGPATASEPAAAAESAGSPDAPEPEPQPSATPEPRRIRTSGGWLQVLD